jgi:hypothetical protein
MPHRTNNATNSPQTPPGVGISDLLSGSWEQYQPKRARNKTFYDIKLRDGEIVECCWPNGIGWYPMHPNKSSRHHRIADYRVLEIRKCKHPCDMDDNEPDNSQGKCRFTPFTSAHFVTTLTIQPT